MSVGPLPHQIFWVSFYLKKGCPKVIISRDHKVSKISLHSGIKEFVEECMNYRRELNEARSNYLATFFLFLIEHLLNCYFCLI